MAFSGVLLAAIIGAMCLCANSYPYPESVAQDLEDMARRYDDDVDSAQFTDGGAEFAGMGPQDDINPSFQEIPEHEVEEEEEEEEGWPLEDAETEGRKARYRIFYKQFCKKWVCWRIPTKMCKTSFPKTCIKLRKPKFD